MIVNEFICLFFLSNCVHLLGGYDIKIKDSPNLDYMVVPEYTLSVSCSDQKDSVTEVFTVEVTENKDPEATNLPGILRYILLSFSSNAER